MMGRWEKQSELWVEPVNLARRIPEDHLLRKINGIVDLGFVRREVAGSYGRNGQVSIDPVIIMKLMLLLFLDNVRSERELMRVLPPDRLAVVFGVWTGGRGSQPQRAFQGAAALGHGGLRETFLTQRGAMHGSGAHRWREAACGRVTCGGQCVTQLDRGGGGGEADGQT